MEFRNLKDVNFDEFTGDFTVAFDFTGITREKAAEVLQDYFGSEYRHPFDFDDSRIVKDQSGREWKILFSNKVAWRIRGVSFWDQAMMVKDHKVASGGAEYCNRLSTPPISHRDLPLLQDIIKRLREAGGIINGSCHTYI